MGRCNTMFELSGQFSFQWFSAVTLRSVMASTTGNPVWVELVSSSHFGYKNARFATLNSDERGSLVSSCSPLQKNEI